MNGMNEITKINFRTKAKSTNRNNNNIEKITIIIVWRACKCQKRNTQRSDSNLQKLPRFYFSLLFAPFCCCFAFVEHISLRFTNIIASVAQRDNGGVGCTGGVNGRVGGWLHATHNEWQSVNGKWTKLIKKMFMKRRRWKWRRQRRL